MAAYCKQVHILGFLVTEIETQYGQVPCRFGPILVWKMRIVFHEFAAPSWVRTPMEALTMDIIRKWEEQEDDKCTRDHKKKAVIDQFRP